MRDHDNAIKTANDKQGQIGAALAWAGKAKKKFFEDLQSTKGQLECLKGECTAKALQDASTIKTADEDLASKEKQMSAVINALASAQQQIRVLAEVPSGQDTVEIMSAFLRTYHNAHITIHE